MYVFNIYIEIKLHSLKKIFVNIYIYYSMYVSFFVAALTSSLSIIAEIQVFGSAGRGRGGRGAETPARH